MRGLSASVAGLALIIGCSTSSGGQQGGPTQPTCAQSGSFTINVGVGSGLTGSLDACACSPSTMSLTVNWGTDGSATVNGQSCAAYCGARNGSPSLCRDVGLPPVDKDCMLQITCCNSLLATDADGIPSCTTNGQMVGGVQFYALSGGPADVYMVPAYTTTYPGCQCSYCSEDIFDAGACK